MADEITLTRWCDLCPPRTSPAATRWRVMIRDTAQHGSDPAARLLDTCTEHAGPVLALVGEVRAHGRVEDRPRTARALVARGQAPREQAPPEQETPMPNPRMITCPCGAVLRRDALREHARDVHKIKFKPMRRCPDCGHRSEAPQGMSAHRRTAHGVDSGVETCDLIRARL